jgi:hypothetical protein
MAVKLAPGKTYDITATIVDTLGDPSTVADPTFNQTGTPDEVVTLTQTGDTTATVLAVAPGSDVVLFAGQDGFDNEVAGSVELEVADATALRLQAGDAVNCTLNMQGGATPRLLVFVPPEPAGDPSFVLRIKPVDESGSANPAFSFADGPDCTVTGTGILLEFGSSTSDDDEIACQVTARGTSTISATAVTDGSGATITGSLEVRVVTASSVTLAVTRQPSA